MDEIKIKYLTKEQLVISIDRLTRFKYTEKKYLRVFYEIITNNLISPKYKKTTLEDIENSYITELAQKIINQSLYNLGLEPSNDFEINKKISLYENSIYNLEGSIQDLLNNKIDYKCFTQLITENSPQNLQWLKGLSEQENIVEYRKDFSTKFPIEKIVLVEGATEETLLPVFAQLCGYNFDKNGIHIVSAGGKNQVVKLYYELIEFLKIPIFILLDSDATENQKEILPKLRKSDRIHLLNCGEFEDLLPFELVRRTLDYELNNISILEKELLDKDSSMVKNLEEIFKTRGRHEFKKVEFAQDVKKNIKSLEDTTPEIKEIIMQIKDL